MVLRRLLIVPDRPFLPRRGRRSRDAVHAFDGSGLRGCRAIVTGDCCAKMAMKAHAMPAPMKQVPCKGISLDCANQFGLHLFAGTASSVDCARVPHCLWIRGILARPLPAEPGCRINPTSFPYSRSSLINRSTALAHAFGSHSGVSARL